MSSVLPGGIRADSWSHRVCSGSCARRGHGGAVGRARCPGRCPEARSGRRCTTGALAPAAGRERHSDDDCRRPGGFRESVPARLRGTACSRRGRQQGRRVPGTGPAKRPGPRVPAFQPGEDRGWPSHGRDGVHGVVEAVHDGTSRPGVVPGEGAQDVLQLSHAGRGGRIVAHDVADDEGERAVPQRERVVPVATDLRAGRRGLVPGGQLDPAVLGQTERAADGTGQEQGGVWTSGSRERCRNACPSSRPLRTKAPPGAKYSPDGFTHFPDQSADHHTEGRRAGCQTAHTARAWLRRLRG